MESRRIVPGRNQFDTRWAIIPCNCNKMATGLFKFFISAA